MYICMYVYNVCMYVNTNVCMYVCMYVYIMYVCMYVNTNVCMYVCVCVYACSKFNFYKHHHSGQVKDTDVIDISV